MHTFMRLSHLKKDADGFKSLYLHMGHFTIVLWNMGMDNTKTEKSSLVHV